MPLHTTHITDAGTSLAVDLSADARVATVTVELSTGPRTIDVYGPHDMFGRQEPAKVNWGGIGSVLATDASIYAEALAHAATIAAAWTTPFFAEGARA